MTKDILASLTLSAFALCSAPAFATEDLSGLSGYLDGNYTYSNDRVGPAVDSNQYTVRGALTYTFDNPGFGFQIDGQDNFYFGPKYDLAHLWSAGGSLFFRDDKGTIGLSGSYFSVDDVALPLFTGKTSIESYGFFGEYYPFRTLTLQIKGGGTTGPVGLTSYYGGGGLTYYDGPDLSAHIEANVTSFQGHGTWTDFNASLEYLPFHSIPMSFYAGYDHAIVAGLGGTATSGTGTSALFAGIRYHFGAGHVLADYDRTGPVQYTGNATPGANLKF